jgi:hypothetical protein
MWRKRSEQLADKCQREMGKYLFNVVTQTYTNQRNAPINTEEMGMKTKDEYIKSLVSELSAWSASSVETVNLTNWNLLSFILNFLIAA